MGDSSGKCVWFLDDASAIDIIALGVELLQNPSFNNSKTALTVWTHSDAQADAQVKLLMQSK